MKKRERICVAIGGFLIMIGAILTGVTLLILFNLIDTTVFQHELHMSLLMLTLFLIGILDFTAGIILLRR
ncbi:MAG: hypothetical protein QXK93_06240 [Candidatus Bathyarchaeia archaeon]|nr:hypothetical protein [Candidatus Bathyarchaeota archaeon]